MPELPSGTLTFLFTDIEGSTPLWEMMPEVMDCAITLHHTILREVIEANNGVVFKIIGDAFQAAFQLASQGLNTAIDIQRRLATAEWPEACGPLKVRIGLHVGSAVLDARGDYAASHTLNRVGRVMSAGHGGQILLSQEAKDLMERSLPAGVSVKNMGEHRLKGLSIPEHLYQVVAPGLVADFPPLVTFIQHSHTPLLTTKLYIPPLRQELVSRPRLIERLNAGLDRSLTLISAPAGFGKTTLLSEWIAGSGNRVRVAWVSLDEGDNDTARFWSYVITGLQTLEPAIGQTALGVLQASQAQPFSFEPLLISLVNDITTLVVGKRPCILVLDDYHILKTESIHNSLDYLLDHLPPILRLVVASREDPPLALSLLRGRGQLNEIRAADLRFMPGETGEFLNAVMDLKLSTNDIAALETRTEGWVAGLQMAALSLQGQTDPEAHDFVSAFTGDDRYVADYLLDQVLNRQTPDIQRFLLQTSILDRLCGPLCDAVMASQSMSPDSLLLDSRQVLEYLERTGLFVIPLDNRRHWYRYHHLFADLLRSRLQEVSEPLSAVEGEKAEKAELHLRASAWFEGEGLIVEAIDHALASTDYVRVADLIERHHKETVWLGEFTSILRWLEALPKALVRTRPFLCIIYSAMMLSHSTEEAEAWLQAAEEAWEAQSHPVDGSVGPASASDREIFSANVLDIRATIADVNGAPTEEIIALTMQALEKTPEEAPSLRASMLQRLGWFYLNLGDEGVADRFFLQSKKLGETSGHHGNTINATIGHVVIAWRNGRLHEAVAICRETLQSIVEPLERSGRRLPAARDLYIILGRILLELNELGEAESMLTKGVELAELTTPVRSADLLDGYHALASLRCIERDFEGALAWMDRAERTFTWAREGARALRVRIWLWQARVENDHQALDQALRWARERNLESPAGNEWELQSLAQAYIAGYRAYGTPDLDPLLGILDEQLRLAEETGAVDPVIQILVLEALALQAKGLMDQAMIMLERALTLAAPEGYTRIFLDKGLPMARLLYQAAQRGIVPEYAAKLLSAFNATLTCEADATIRQSANKGQDSWSVDHPMSIVEPLTHRETQVLQLIAEGLSNREIAQRLFISLSTVKRHNATIFGKLGVNSRTLAVARGRDLGLL